MTQALSKRCYVMSEPHLSGWWLVIGFESMEDVNEAHRAVVAIPREYAWKPASAFSESRDDTTGPGLTQNDAPSIKETRQ